MFTENTGGPEDHLDEECVLFLQMFPGKKLNIAKIENRCFVKQSFS